MMAAVAAFSRRSNLTEETDASADFLLLEKLGEGSFGKVYRAQQHSIKRHVAIKVVPVAQDTGEVAREIETLKECDSDNIVRCGPHRRPDTFFLGQLPRGIPATSLQGPRGSSETVIPLRTSIKNQVFKVSAARTPLGSTFEWL